LKKKVLEESVLFVSILKWVFLASCAGILVGISTAVFLKLLGKGIALAGGVSYYYLLPVALFSSSLIVRYLAPEAEGHGTEKVIEAVHKKAGKINPLVVPVKLVATIITIAGGGSAGKEGPCAQIGAGVSSIFADLLRFDDRDRRKLVICGISAGFSTVFGTPIAGAIFGVEVLAVGGMMYEVLLPSFIAGIIGFQVSSSLGISYFHEPLFFVPLFSSSFFIKVCASGIFFGLCSLSFIEITRLVERGGKRISLWPPLRGFIGGLLLAGMAWLFSVRYLGLGLETIKESIEGGLVPAGGFLLKMLFTAVTLAFGGSGGVVTPIFFIGATAGNTFATALGFEPSIFAAIGMVSLLAGAANTPISASIMAVELFGPDVAPYAAVACVISFLMTGHRSIYPSQVLSITKSSSLLVETGREMKETPDVEFEPRDKSLSGGIAKGIRKVGKSQKGNS
jgi:H+/Cl- antiporter ClcA